MRIASIVGLLADGDGSVHFLRRLAGNMSTTTVSSSPRSVKNVPNTSRNEASDPAEFLST